MAQERWKLSTVGQISLPARLRRNWNISGGGQLSVLKANSTALVMPDGSEYSLVEALYPQSSLRERAMRIPLIPRNKTSIDKLTHKAKLSGRGQFVPFDKDVRHQVGLTDGTHVQGFEFTNAFVISGNPNVELAKELPLNVLQDDDWLASQNYNMAGAYIEWCAEIGRSIMSYMVNANMQAPQRLESSTDTQSYLGSTISHAILQQAMLSI
jgi:hypothetical protein